MKVSSPLHEQATTGVDIAALGKSSRRALLFATLIGLCGVVVLILYLRRFEEEVSGGGRVGVLSLVKPVTRGTPIRPDMLTVSSIPRAYVEQRAVRAVDRDKVVGVRSATALSAQDTLMWSDLALANEERDLATLVQPGKRAVTVSASEAGSDPAGNGLVRPGDYVDVIVTLQDGNTPGGRAPTSAIVLLQRVLVLAVGSQTEPFEVADDRGSNRNRNRERELTLSLRIEDVQILSLARERGTLSVALRSPQDTKVIENIADMPAASLYSHAARGALQQQQRTLSNTSNGASDSAATNSQVPKRVLGGP
jgi:pilus assembly protein CpaB